MPAIVTYQKENRKAPLLQAKITRFKTQEPDEFRYPNSKTQFPNKSQVLNLKTRQIPILNVSVSFMRSVFLEIVFLDFEI